MTLYATYAIAISNSVGSSQSFNTDGSISITTTGGNQTVYLNTQTLNFTGGSNNYIFNLAHIYGNTSASGGGLAMDYIYFIGFNGAGGNNANLYASGGTLQMTNYSGGINIYGFNPAGTGPLSIYSASNDVVVGTGLTNIALNSGSNIYLNSAGSNGVCSIYTSTLNTTSLLDTNIGCQRNLNINGTAGKYTTINHGSNYFQFNDTGNTTINSVGDFTINSSNFTLNASGVNKKIIINTPSTILGGDFSRKLFGNVIQQPVIQYGTTTATGASGSVVVYLTVGYTSATSYVVTASMMDVTPASISVNRDSSTQFTIYWDLAGSGTQTLGWTTMGQ